MTKTKDTIEELSLLIKENTCRFKEGDNGFDKGYDKESKKIVAALSHAIQIAEAQEQAEGMLPEITAPEKRIAKPLCEISFNKGRIVGHNSAISIAQPILAKKILEIQELEKEIEKYKCNTGWAESIRLDREIQLLKSECEEKDKRIKELLGACEAALYNIDWMHPKEDEIYKTLKQAVDKSGGGE